MKAEHENGLESLASILPPSRGSARSRRPWWTRGRSSIADIAATKLKVIQDRGALRDYFDLMVIDEHIPMEEGLRLLVDKYQPLAPAGLIANIIRGLGYLGDVEDDPSLPVPREQIESFWASRQPRLVRHAL